MSTGGNSMPQYAVEGRIEDGLAVLTSPHARHPLKCRPDSSDMIVYYQIFLEREYACLDDVVAPGLIIDCGANIGLSSAYFLTRYPGCQLIAVEPDGGNFEMLRLNLKPYGPSARLVRSAIWSHPAPLTMAETSYRGGGAWARQVRECRPDERPEFLAVDIPGLLLESGQERLSILKMDIEGAEAVVFATNADAWLGRVDNLVVELHDDSSFGNASTIFAQAIAGQGFTVTQSGELTVCKRK